MSLVGNLNLKSVGGKGLRSKYDDEIVKFNTDANYGHLEIQLKVTEVSNKRVWFTLHFF